MMSGTVLRCIVLCLLAWAAAPSFGQEPYPSRTVQLIVPFPPGGSQDIVNRRLAEKFREIWGQPVVVINRPGANGVVAWQALLSTKPDGYNILAPAGEGLGYVHLMNSSIGRPFLEEFVPVSAYAHYPVVFLTNSDIPVGNLRELGAYAKSNPSALSYGTTGAGSGGHLLFEFFKAQVGVSDTAMPAIHYAGIAPEITALVGKQIQTAIMPLSSIAGKQIDAGTIRALAVSAPNRSIFRKEIPTVVEQGFLDLAARDYLSFWVIDKTPPAVVAKIADATRLALQDPDVRKKIEEMYLEPEFLGGADIRKQFELRSAQFGPLIKKLDIKAQ